MPFEDIRSRLHRGEVITIDGAMGTELGKVDKQGVELGQESWSAAPLATQIGREAIAEIHRRNIRSGAELIITNTFRVNRLRNYGQATLAACELAQQARESVERPNVAIAGSIGPIGDCYTPGDTPEDKKLHTGHASQAKLLKKGGVDVGWIETMPTLRESVIAAQKVAEAELPVAVSVYCDPNDGTRLLPYRDHKDERWLGGESLEEVLETFRHEGIALVSFGVNCVTPGAATQSVVYLDSLRHKPPVSVYAQGYDESSPFHDANIDDYCRHYMKFIDTWLQAGAQLVGGCCGVPPEWIKAIGTSVQMRNSTQNNYVPSRP